MLLSIIIPTKNRYNTLFNVVDTILGFDINDELEIVIQDNSDNNTKALSFIEERKRYMNLRYFHEAGNLSVIENSDKAVLNSIGEYVCFIGDDDGIMPNIVKVTRWMKQNDYKALKAYKPSYYWPNQKSNYLSNDITGVLKYKKWKENSFQVIKTKEALDFTLQRGGVSIRKLPCLYHGIVERKTLDLIYKKTNTFFPGPSPDMANAVALTQVIDSYVQVHYPVVISGKSSKSTGGAGVLHQHVSRIEDVKHLPKSTARNWSPLIPKYWTGPTIWAESILKALESFENKEALERFNYNYLYAYLSVFHKKHSEEIFNGFKIENPFNFLLLKSDIFLFRLRYFVINRIGKIHKVNNIKDIKAAVNFISKVPNS